jgi:hypothetical protein
MVYKNISSKAVLAKIYRDFKPGYSGWEADAIEWMGEALDYIGCSAGFEMHSESIPVYNHRAALPANFYTLRGVEYEDEPLPYGGDFVNDRNYFAIEVAPPLTQNDVIDPNNVTRVDPDHWTGDYYLINPNYIQTSFETGDIIVKYYRYPIDKDGLPLIPDNIYVKKALSWYVAMMMAQGGNLVGQFTFSDAKMIWEHACVQAGNDVMFPSPDKAERFREMWVRLIPHEDWNTDAHFELDYDIDPDI